jgi:hydroxymethylglutaryl-CoA reductase
MQDKQNDGDISNDPQNPKDIKGDIHTINGFHKLTFQERLQRLKEARGFSDEEVRILSTDSSNLPIAKADIMIENCIGMFPIPIGIARNFLINGKKYLIPMATEEPSVVAGANKAAKLAAKTGGFTASASDPIMIGQIQFSNIEYSFTKKDLDDLIIKEKNRIEQIAKNSDPRLYELGGGLRELWSKEINTPRSRMQIVEFSIDVRDAMGANAVNTLAEKIGSYLKDMIPATMGIRILSNLCVKRMAKSTARFDLSEEGGDRILEKILDAQAFAEADVFRATTHNKGIMNGITAVCLALGNDTRAIEAAVHSYAAISGTYKPLTTYRKISDTILEGIIELPLAVGTVGGISQFHPTAHINKKILNVERATELSVVCASVGLAQNLAALLALCGKGIQDAHMKLHHRKQSG